MNCASVDINMPFLTAENFCKRHGGIDSLITFMKMCHSGASLKELAERFNLSKAQISQIRRKIMKEIWEPQRGALEFVEWMKHAQEEQLKDRYESVEDLSKPSPLKFIVGRK